MMHPLLTLAKTILIGIHNYSIPPRMTIRTFSFLVLLLISFFPSRLLAEDSLTVNFPISSVVRYKYSGISSNGTQQWFIPDSGLIQISSVDLATRDHYNSLGTLGSALKPQVFKPDQEILPTAGIRAYDPYKWKSDSLRYYRTNKRFSQIDYHNASFKEQEIRLLHSQNILKNWSAGLDFHRLGVKDFTRNSDTYQNQLAFFSWYESPNGRYNQYLSALWNTFKNQMNGGLRSDSLFDTGNITNLGLKGLSINLTDAAHQFRNHEFALQQDYNLLNEPDSGENTKRFINEFKIVHRTHFESGSFAYSDGVTDSSFYDNFYNSTSTYDSLHYYDLKNSAGFLLPRSDSATTFFFKNFSTQVEFEHQWYRYTQRDEWYLNNYLLKAMLFSPVNDSTYHLSSSLDYVVAGENSGLYKFDAKIATPAFKTGSFFLSVSALRKRPDQIYQNYYSNHFIWSNNFKDIHSQNLRGGLDNAKFKFRLEFILHRIENFTYISTDATPSQFEGSIEISQLRLMKNFSFGKWHLDNDLYLQENTESKILALPAYTGTHSIYLENHFFKKALQAQFGVQVNFNSAYYSDRFMPATALFYLQDVNKTGGYALIDIFIHLKIKSARIFLKIENIGDGLVADQYYQTPHYPQAGRTLKFGLNWRFYDM